MSITNVQANPVHDNALWAMDRFPIPLPPPPRADASQFTADDLYQEGGPVPEDIGQNSIGDCYYVASLGALANTEAGRQHIRDSISYDPDTGNYTVTLYVKGPFGVPVPVQVEVTQAELQDNIERGGGSNLDNNGGEGALWPAVMETAFAKLNDSNPANGLDEGYREISGGKARDAMFTLTGTDGDDVSNAFVSTFGPDVAYEVIRQAMADGRPVTLSTDPENKGAPEDGLADNHVYVVEEIYKDEDGQVMVTLRNPWGQNNTEGKTNDSPLITVPLEQITEDGGFEYFNIGPN